MKAITLSLVTSSAIALSACTTVKTLQATGGSRSDGVVHLSYQYATFQVPKVRWEQGDRTAKQRCQAWGYADAERFGGVEQECMGRNAYGTCMAQRVTVPYQCLGDPDTGD